MTSKFKEESGATELIRNPQREVVKIAVLSNLDARRTEALANAEIQPVVFGGDALDRSEWTGQDLTPQFPFPRNSFVA
jgi:hypothetical protein